MPVRGIGVVTEKNAKPYRTHTVARYRDTHMLYLPIVGMLVSRPTLYLPSNNQQLVVVSQNCIKHGSFHQVPTYLGRCV